MMRKLFFILSTNLLISAFYVPLLGQAPMPAMHSGEIQMALKKLQVLGSVLYIAAHPDDENTRMISYLEGERGYRVTYLSLTRGDGGQNLIGEEKGPSLGILRTQELLAARRIDGGEQMFSRALDFGYSKTPEEALAIWDKETILSDVVWAIRKVRPDIIITRFARPIRGGGGHGHHTASAMLVKEAVEISGDPETFPDQLAYVSPWTPERILWNTYTWRRYQPSEEDQKILLSMNLDTYNPFLGKGYGEIAAEARSMHRCQAFGAAKVRGERIESLLHVFGSIPQHDMMEGINTTWSRVENSKQIKDLLEKAYQTFQPSAPEKIVPLLLQAYKAMKHRSEYWMSYQREKVKELIAYCSGIYFEVNTEVPTLSNEDSVLLTASIIKRSSFPVRISDIYLKEIDQTLFQPPLRDETTLANADATSGMTSADPNILPSGKLEEFEQSIYIKDLPISQPYWLQSPPKKGVYQVDDQAKIGLPENPPALTSVFSLEFGTEDPISITYNTPVVHKYVDRAIGELYRPFVITPTITTNFQEGVYLFADSLEQHITALVKTHKANIQTTVSFEVPEGWEVHPANKTLTFEEKGEEQLINLTVTPSSAQSQGQLKAIAKIGENTNSHSFTSIAYDHIPTQLVFDPAEVTLVKVNLKKAGNKIGYLMGSGDEVPESLRQIDYDVDLLEDEDITLGKLSTYDAVIGGIRVYNTRKRMPFHYKTLMQYIEQGGVYIVQYNTSYSLTTEEVGPYPFSISRDRISDETAELSILDPSHRVFHYPNTITQEDFEGWVQERGLYFANAWDEKYVPLLEGNDPGEDPKKGALLVAKYGKGYFVYCGLSMFRELPKGVPGAYRLFANIISLGQNDH